MRRGKVRQPVRAAVAALYLPVCQQADGAAPVQRSLAGAIEVEPRRVLGTGDEEGFARRLAALRGKEERPDHVVDVDGVADPVAGRRQDHRAGGQQSGRPVRPMFAEWAVDDGRLHDRRVEAVLPDHARELALRRELVVAGLAADRARFRQRAVRQRFVDRQGADVHQPAHPGPQASFGERPDAGGVGVRRAAVPRQVKHRIAALHQAVDRAGGAVRPRHVEAAQLDRVGRQARHAGGVPEGAQRGPHARPLLADQSFDQPPADETARPGDQHPPAA